MRIRLSLAVRRWPLMLMSVLVSPALGEPLNLDRLIAEAVRENPSLRELRQRVEAARSRVPVAGALSDPVVQFESSNIPLNSFALNRSPITGNQVTISQTLPFPGTRGAREEAARERVLTAALQVEDREVAIANLVKQVYFSMAFLDRAIEIAEQNETLLEEFVRIAESKYAVGNGLQQDVLKAQVSLSSMRDRLIRLRADRRRAAALMNLVLNREPGSEVGRPEAVELSLPTSDSNGYRDRAFSTRPLLAGIEHTSLMWKAKEREALGQRWPNLTFSVGYRQRAFMTFDPVQGSDFLSFGVGMNLPIYRGRKQNRLAAEARANVKAVGARLETARARIAHQIEVLTIAMQEHRDKADLFRTAILPQARQSLDSALSGYQVDQVDFLTLLDSQVTLLEFEIDAYGHIIEHEKKRAELEAVVGVRLEDQTGRGR